MSKDKFYGIELILLFFFVIQIFILIPSCVKVQALRVLKVAVHEVLDTTAHSAIIMGEIIDIGSSPLSEYGICWAEHDTPGFEDQVTKIITSVQKDTFIVSINGLVSGRQYYVRAYAKDRDQTVYSKSELVFSTKQSNSILPRISTDSVTNITDSSAFFYGNLLEIGLPAATQYGFVWSENSLPDFYHDSVFTDKQIVTGIYSFEAGSLTPGTRYYVRAWTMNTDTLVYGQILNFVTATQLYLPQVSMAGMMDITHLSARAGGNIINPGNPAIIHYGHCWSTVSPPLAGLPAHTDFGATNSAGKFSSSLDSLTPDTKYYIRAYAITQSDTVYSEETVFFTYKNERSFMTDIRDGQRYAIVLLGDQWWMAENLSVYTQDSSWYYNNDSLGYAVDNGRLYSYSAALNSCPAGWHLPSDEEWKTLEMFLGMSQSEADKDGYRGNTEGTLLLKAFGNTTGFDVIYSGYRNQDNTFYSLNSFAYFWTSTSYLSNYAWCRYVNTSDPRINRNHFQKEKGFSIRCIKDQ